MSSWLWDNGEVMTKPPETHAEAPAVAARHGGRLLAPARYRHPGDVIRLTLAGLVLAGAAAVTVTAHATYAGASAAAVTAVAPSTVAARVLGPGWLSWCALLRRDYV
jgi:hypothetical protein